MRKAALLVLFTVLSFSAWGQGLALHIRGSVHEYAFPSAPMGKSYPGARLGTGLDISLGENHGYLSTGIESGFNSLSVASTGTDVPLILVPITFSLTYQYPFQKFLKGRFTLGGGLLTGVTAGIAGEKQDFLFLIGPRLEGSFRLWNGRVPGSLYLGLGADFIPQQDPMLVVLPAVELGLRIRIPLGAAAKSESASSEDAPQEETADTADGNL